MKNIISIYTEEASTMLEILDMMILSGSVKVLAADPARLYNDANHDDVVMASITFETGESVEDVKLASELCTDDSVYICEEDPQDWE